MSFAFLDEDYYEHKYNDGDEFDDNNEFDYGDEQYEDEYKDFADNIADELDYAEAMARQAPVHVDAVMGANRSDRMAMFFKDPLDRFQQDLRKYIETYESELKISDLDKNQLMVSTKDIPLVQYKNVGSYVLGYLLYRNESRAPELFNDYMLDASQNVTKKELVKYSRFWKYVMDV